MSTDKTDLPKELALAETTAVTSEGQEIKAEIIPDREGVKKILGIGEPKIQSPESRLEQNQDIKLLVAGLEMTDGGGYFRLSIPEDIPSEAVIGFVKKHIPDTNINIHEVTKISLDERGTYDDESMFLKWIFEIQKAPKDSQGSKTIFVVDLSKVAPETGISSYFAEMNIKRDKIAGNPNGPVLVITPILSKEMERFIHGTGDLRSCCSGQYTL